jgi:hypothetical protein
MYSRIQYESWHEVIPMIAFGLTLTVFLYFLIRAFRMRKATADGLARLPLDDE